MYDSFVFLYPHTPYFETSESNLLTNRPDINMVKTRKFYKRQVTKARTRALSTYLVLVKHEDGSLNEISPLARQTPNDKIILTDVLGNAIDAPTRYSDYERIARTVPGQNILLGGFHMLDCVFQLGLELFCLNKSVDIAMLTTDYFYHFLSLPDNSPKKIGQFSYPISLPEFLHHFRHQIKRIWDFDPEA